MNPSDALPAPSGKPIQVDPPLSASGAGTTPVTNGTSSHGAAPTSSRLSSGQGIRASTPTQKASPLALFVGFSLAALFLIFFVSAGVFNALFQSGLEAPGLDTRQVPRCTDRGVSLFSLPSAQTVSEERASGRGSR